MMDLWPGVRGVNKTMEPTTESVNRVWSGWPSRFGRSLLSRLSPASRIACGAITAVLCLIIQSGEAMATVYFDETFENIAVDTELADTVHNGVLYDWDQGTASPELVKNAVKATIATPNGSRYLEAHGLCSAYTNNRCTSGSTTNAGVNLTNSGGGLTEITNLVDGTTYYLGTFVRYQRVSSRDIFDDTGTPADSWNKTFEFDGPGTRWGIGVGWPQNYNGVDHKFTADIWCSSGAYPAWCVTDHPAQNANGYSAGNPYLMDYERWYAIVMGITTSTSAVTGRIRLWVNGTLIEDRNQQTMNSGADYDSHWLQSTFAQGAYDAPEAYYQMDHLIFTDSLTDITNAGLMEDPEGGGESGHVVMFFSQALGWILMTLQMLFILGYFWERRTKAINALVAIHSYYWALRYRHAVKRWQKDAPLMLPAPMETITLNTIKEHEWRK